MMQAPASHNFYCLSHTPVMEQMTKSLQQNLQICKSILTSEDILTYSFSLPDGTGCCVLYADGITNKDLLGEQVIRPLLEYKGDPEFSQLSRHLTAPELKEEGRTEELIKAVLDGNPVLFVDGSETAAILGTKTVPARAITEPQTEITVSGPRAGFIEDLKTNMGQVRIRFKTPALQFKLFQVGKQSNTNVTVCFLKGIADETIVKKIVKKIQDIRIDSIPDSSYIGKFLSEHPYSLFKQVGTTEKPDIFCAKLAEGRVGILVDGSPIALTLPYLLVEELQSPDDYYLPAYRATFTRILRVAVLLLAIYLPALYIAAQLFKQQIIPISLLLTIASSIQGLPLSPSMEIFVTLMVLEILNEASIRMPKYVGLALSVVGALVLGDTAVSAGIISTPAIILIAFSGISLYTVPGLHPTTSVLRLIFLLIAGSIGIYGMVLFTDFLIAYLLTSDSYGAPLLAPFAPLVRNDLRDSLIKYNLLQLKQRPQTFDSPNRTRLRHE